MIKRRVWLLAVLVVAVGGPAPHMAQAVAVSPGAIGDALIFPLIEVSNLDTLIAIESFEDRTALHRVRFRHGATGNPVLEFSLCLPPFSTWTAGVFRDGPLTRIVSASTLLVDGSPIPLDTTLSGNPTRAFLEVIGLRLDVNPAVCTSAALGGDVPNTALLGKAYYVNSAQVPPLVFGGNAVALRDFALAKISDGTVFGNETVAQALIDQGTSGVPSNEFTTRYFVPAALDAVTQVVLAFPTGPLSQGCPSCRAPANLTIIPYTEAGADLAVINLPSDTSLVRVITLSSAQIANESGILQIFETGILASAPVVGFGVNTTTASAPMFFNVLFPLGLF